MIQEERNYTGTDNLYGVNGVSSDVFSEHLQLENMEFFSIVLGLVLNHGMTMVWNLSLYIMLFTGVTMFNITIKNVGVGKSV